MSDDGKVGVRLKSKWGDCDIGDLVAISVDEARDLVRRGIAGADSTTKFQPEAQTTIRVRFLRDSSGRRAGDVTHLSASVALSLMTAKVVVDADRFDYELAASLATKQIAFVPADLSGLMIGQAFLKFAIEDPRVQALGSCLTDEFSQFRRVFETGVFPGGLSSHQWPVVLDADRLAAIIARHAYGKFEASPTSVMRLVSAALADRYNSVTGLLCTGALLAVGTSAATFSSVPLRENEWTRPDRWIDLKTSDVWYREGATGKVFWMGVSLTLPAKPAGVQNGNGRRDVGGRPRKFAYDTLPQKLPILMSRKGRAETKAELIGWVQSLLALPCGTEPDEADVRKYLQANFSELYEDAGKNAGKNRPG
jgi:hypothetical protein